MSVKRLFAGLLSCVLLLSQAYAATGDVLAVGTSTNGAFLTIKLEGMAGGGDYAFGLGENNDPSTGSPKVVLTVVSQGYTGGVLGTRTRTIYGTKWVRQPFSMSGNELLPAETVDGSDLIVTIALSESIYDSDNNTGGTGGNSGVVPTVSIASGFYSKSGTPNNAVTGFTVTNNSTLAYPRVIGNWSRPSHYEKVGASHRLGMSASHGHGMNGQLVDSVVFLAKDASGHSASSLVTAATIDSTYGDPLPVIEHITDINTSGFTQGDIGEFNFVAYPWIGNANSILNSRLPADSGGGTGTASAPSPYYGPLYFVCDPAGTYSPHFAVVNSTSGNDGSGAIGSGTVDLGSLPSRYATISGAYNALRSKNNTDYGRNNCGGGVIFLEDNAGATNSYAWMGGTPTIGTRPSCYLHIRNLPGVARDKLTLATQSGGKSAGEIVRISGVTITATNASGVFDVNSTTSYLWLDDCVIDSSVTPMVYRVGVWNMTRCTIKNFSQGWTNYGAVNSVPSICRGNTIADTCTSLGPNQAFMILGNQKTSTLAHMMGAPIAITGSPVILKNNTIGFNRITAGNTSGAILRGGENTNDHGSAFIQNVIENCNNSSPAMQIAADRSNTVANNILIVHNVVVGQRGSLAYNEYGATGYDRLNWFIKNNLLDDLNYKSDTFLGNTASMVSKSYNSMTQVVTVTVTQTGHQFNDGDLIYIKSANPSLYTVNGATVINPTANANEFQYQFSYPSDPSNPVSLTISPNPNRIKNWPVGYGVGCSGNIYAETAGIGAATNFLPDFAGIKSIPSSVTGQPPTVAAKALDYFRFVDRRSFNGTNGAGNGNYRLQADSPAVGMAKDWVLPYDLDGKARRAGGASGPYEFSQSGLLLLKKRR